METHDRGSAKWIGQVDWTDPAASKKATETILKEKYGVTISLPDNKLCPPVPNRENYIKWMKYLSGVVPSKTATEPAGRNDNTSSTTVLDIGSGASCIYAILGVISHGWSFICSELDPSSIEWTRNHVLTSCNPSLLSHIELVQTANSIEIQSRIESVMMRRSTDPMEKRHISWPKAFTLTDLLTRPTEVGLPESGDNSISLTLNQDYIASLRGPIRQALNNCETYREILLQYELSFAGEMASSSRKPVESQHLLDMTMCNPPFYDMQEQIIANQNTVCLGQETEMRTTGGEVLYTFPRVSRIITVCC
jgi:23S rRNA A1618 N6-methylase RlmF